VAQAAPMIYIKSVLAGIIAVVVSIVVLATIWDVGLRVWIRLRSGGSGFYSIHISLSSPLLWGFGLLIFGAGFYWEYRRLSS
jgi:hypothetical protein